MAESEEKKGSWFERNVATLMIVGVFTFVTLMIVFTKACR